MDYKKFFEKFDDKNVFLKTSKHPSIEISQKTALNRRGNVLFNSGDIEGARRIFMTTGYSDGLSRVGDYYKSQNRPIEALRMNWIARDRKKSDPLIMKIAEIMRDLINEKEGPFNA